MGRAFDDIVQSFLGGKMRSILYFLVMVVNIVGMALCFYSFVWLYEKQYLAAIAFLLLGQYLSATIRRTNISL